MGAIQPQTGPVWENEHGRQTAGIGVIFGDWNDKETRFTKSDLSQENYLWETGEAETWRSVSELADLLRKHGGKTGEELKAEWASLHIPFRFKVVQWGNLKVFKQFLESELLNLSKN